MAVLIIREIYLHLSEIYNFPSLFSVVSCLIFRTISHFAEGLSICDPLKIKHLI